MYSATDIEKLWRKEVRRGRRSSIDPERLERQREIIRITRALAQVADESGFKDLLVTGLGIEEGSPKYRAALAEFWNVVQEYEKPPRGKS